MFYIINTYGTTRAVITEPIYQGSVGVNSITLLAPFPSNVIIEVNAILPNGLRIKNLNPLTATIYPEGMPPIFDPNGKPYTTFSGIIDSSLTQQAGIVQIQFKVMLGVGKVLGTYMTSFNVSEGAEIEELPPPSDSDYYNKILQYLAEIDKDAIKSVVFSDPNHEELPSSVDRGTFPNGTIVTTPTGTTANITDDSAPPFINVVTPIPPGAETPYFIFNYSSALSIDVVQFYMESPTGGNVEIQAVTYLDGIQNGSYNLTINQTKEIKLINPRFFLEGKGLDKIEFYINTPRDPLYVKGVQVFTSSETGKYIITFESGAQAVINAPSVGILKAYLEYAQDEADRAKSEADRAASEATEASESASAAKESEIASSAAASAANYNAGEARTYANNASASATEAKNSADRAEQALNTILGRRTVFYESSMTTALGAIATYSDINEGDIVVIGALGVPDLIVFKNDSQALLSAQAITLEQISSGEYPEITAGAKYRITGGINDFGFVAIESGIDTSDFVTSEELSEELNKKQNALSTTPLTIVGTNALGEIVNYKIAQNVPGVETDSDSIINTAIFAQTIGDIETALDNIITLQNSYINGGATS